MKMTIKNIVNITLPVTVLMALLFCSEQPTDPPENGNVEPAAMLTVSDTGLTRLGLRLQLQNAHLPTLAALTRANVKDTLHDTLLFRHTLTGSDTAFYDDNLQPNENYLYELWLAKDSTQQQWYRFAFNRRTMDTTGHNFSWQVYEFGGAGGSSYLNDVAIVDENNIWAVGRISVADSAGEFENYNAVHWDGEKWELVKIPFTGPCSAVKYPELTATYAFSENDIWFARAGSLVHYNGENFRNDCGMNELINGAIKRIWGTSTQDLYIVGNGGTIVHYDGQSWTKLESGTDVNLTDVWGTSDGNTVWACGWTSGEPYSVLLSIRNNQVAIERYVDIRMQPSDPDSMAGNLSTGVFLQKKTYVASSSAVYTFTTNGVSKRFYPRLRYFPSYMDATDINNIWICGDRSMLWHFNGSTPQYIGTDYDGHFNSISVHSKGICAVGESFDIFSKGKIILLKP